MLSIPGLHLFIELIFNIIYLNSIMLTFNWNDIFVKGDR